VQIVLVQRINVNGCYWNTCSRVFNNPCTDSRARMNVNAALVWYFNNQHSVQLDEL